jgi:Domain of unknown function (DUF4136)
MNPVSTPTHHPARRLVSRKLAATLLAAAGLTAFSGCAGLRVVSSEVSSFGEWPAGRQPTTYAFERLPSQQARPADSDALEARARGAIEKAGFKPVADAATADVLMQVGARDGRADYQLWDDPIWWRGGFGYSRAWGSPRWGGAWGVGSGIGWQWQAQRIEHQVAVLMRDRASGKPLFEARAVSESSGYADAALLTAMFEAALMDFPRLGANPRRVDVRLP